MHALPGDAEHLCDLGGRATAVGFQDGKAASVHADVPGFDEFLPQTAALSRGQS
jgi:hypothetical protein